MIIQNGLEPVLIHSILMNIQAIPEMILQRFLKNHSLKINTKFMLEFLICVTSLYGETHTVLFANN